MDKFTDIVTNTKNSFEIYKFVLESPYSRRYYIMIHAKNPLIQLKLNLYSISIRVLNTHFKGTR